MDPITERLTAENPFFRHASPERSFAAGLEPDPEQAIDLRGICREALEGGGAGPLAVNAADEVLVEAFLEGRIKWSAIPYLMERVLDRFPALFPRDLREVLAADELARRLTGEELAGHAPGRK